MQSNGTGRAIVRTIVEQRPLIMSVAVLFWSTKNLPGLSLLHTNGPELYGVLTAAVAVGAAVANIAVLRSGRPEAIVTAALLVVWAVVAIGGLGGTIAHIVGPVAGHGFVDPRPRPVLAPLMFTLLGVVGGTALVLGRRAAGRRDPNN
jgi:hypothetical protein